MKNVYGYIRVSTQRQGEGVSLIAQKDAITRYASQYNLNIIKWFEEKETAAKQGRPLFTQMMKLLKSRKAHGVIIHKIDRGARNIRDWADINFLIDNGVDIHFAHESLDLNTRGGRLTADIQAAIAADFIRNNRQEVKKGQDGRLKQGIYPFCAPLGYLNTGKGKAKVIDPLRGPLIKKAFQLYATNKFSLKSLLIELRTLGLTNQNGSPIKISNISNVLNNPFYTGIMRVKDSVYNGVHAPLISTQTFRQVQEVLRGNTNKKIIKHDFCYRKILKCKNCRYSIVPEIQKGSVYYRCHTKNCLTTGVREKAIDTCIVRYYAACELFPAEYETLKELLNETRKDWDNVQKELQKTINIQIGSIKQKLDRLNDLYLENSFDKSTFESKKQQLLFDLKSKEEQDTGIRTKEYAILQKAERFLELAKSLIKSYIKANSQEKRDLLQITTSNFCLDGKKVVISMCSPFSELLNRSNIHYGAHSQDNARKIYTEFVSSEEDIPKNRQPLSKDELKSFFDQIISVFSQLPDDNS